MELKDLAGENLDLRDFAINIVKYQNFKTKNALSKFEYKLNETTAANYFGAGVIYVKTKKKNKQVCKKLYNYIDKAIENCVQPLRPSEEDKRRIFKNTYTKKDIVIPAQQAVLELTKNQSITERFEYGVRIGDTVKVFSTSNDAKLFLDGIVFAGQKAKIVSITPMEV